MSNKAGRPIGSKTRTATQIRAEKKAFLDAMETSGGFVGEALKIVGFSYSKLMRMVYADPIFEDAVEQAKKIEAYTVESELLKQIRLGNTQCIIYYLKTAKGARIGYGTDTDTIRIETPVEIQYIVPENKNNHNG